MSERDAMGGGDARQQRGREAAAVAARRPAEGETRRETLGKARAGKAGSGAGERATKKRRKVNHGMFNISLFSCCRVVVTLRFLSGGRGGGRGSSAVLHDAPSWLFPYDHIPPIPCLLALAGELTVGASPRVCVSLGKNLEVSDSG